MKSLIHVLFACLSCELQEKKTAVNSHYTIKESHPPAASQIQKSFSIGGVAPLSPTQHQHQHKNPGGPDQRHIIKINRASSASEEKFEEVF